MGSWSRVELSVRIKPETREKVLAVWEEGKRTHHLDGLFGDLTFDEEGSLVMTDPWHPERGPVTYASRKWYGSARVAEVLQGHVEGVIIEEGEDGSITEYHFRPGHAYERRHWPATRVI